MICAIFFRMTIKILFAYKLCERHTIMDLGVEIARHQLGSYSHQLHAYFEWEMEISRYEEWIQ